MRKIKVGLIQQSNTADIRVNLMNLAKSIEACAAHGAQLIVLQELHNSLISARQKIRICLTLPSLSPDHLQVSTLNWQQLIR